MNNKQNLVLSLLRITSSI